MLYHPRTVLYDANGNPIGTRTNPIVSEGEHYAESRAEKGWVAYNRLSSDTGATTWRFLFDNVSDGGGRAPRRNAFIWQIRLCAVGTGNLVCAMRQNPTGNLPVTGSNYGAKRWVWDGGTESTETALDNLGSLGAAMTGGDLIAEWQLQDGRPFVIRDILMVLEPGVSLGFDFPGGAGDTNCEAALFYWEEDE